MHQLADASNLAFPSHALCFPVTTMFSSICFPIVCYRQLTDQSNERNNLVRHISTISPYAVLSPNDLAILHSLIGPIICTLAVPLRCHSAQYLHRIHFVFVKYSAILLHSGNHTKYELYQNNYVKSRKI